MSISTGSLLLKRSHTGANREHTKKCNPNPGIRLRMKNSVEGHANLFAFPVLASGIGAMRLSLSISSFISFPPHPLVFRADFPRNLCQAKTQAENLAREGPRWNPVPSGKARMMGSSSSLLGACVKVSE